MSARLLVASLGLTVLSAVAACRSSSPYGSPANVAVGTGLAVAAAAANRAVTHECWAACRPGTVCDRATGLCVEPGHQSRPGGAGGSGAPRMVSRDPMYPPGHEYEVPSSSMVDAGCAPVASSAGDGGAIACEMDGATL